MKPKVYFLLPIYNEADNIDLLARNLLAVLPDFDKTYVFSDDASSDDSIQKLRDALPAESLRVITTERNQGPGAAFDRGFRHILHNEAPRDADIIVTLEADNTSDLAILPDMLAINKLGYELVLASVYAQGGSLQETTLLRKILSYGANFLFRFLFEVSVLTLSSFYRVYSVSLLRRVSAQYPNVVKETGFICALELLLKCIQQGARIIEVPMTLQTHLRRGKSKMKVIRTALAYLAFLAEWKRRQKR